MNQFSGDPACPWANASPIKVTHKDMDFGAWVGSHGMETPFTVWDILSFYLCEELLHFCMPHDNVVRKRESY